MEEKLRVFVTVITLFLVCYFPYFTYWF